MSHELAAAALSPIQDYLQELHTRHATLRDGQVATYIPELAKALEAARYHQLADIINESSLPIVVNYGGLTLEKVGSGCIGGSDDHATFGVDEANQVLWAVCLGCGDRIQHELARCYTFRSLRRSGSL